jgi:CHAT domain-containing protein/tetratricopeptide (TPR) repeat protein
LTLDDVVSQLLRVEGVAARQQLLARNLRVFTADELLRHLKASSERYFTVDGHAALRLAESLVTAAELAERADLVPLGLLARADALRLLGRYAEARATFDEAGRAFLEQKDAVGWARTRIGWVIVSYFLGQGAEALTSVADAHATLMAHQEWLRAAGLDQNSALVCYFLGQYDRAITLYDRAQRLFESLGESAEERAAWVKANKAMILTLLGDFQVALALHEEAQEVFIRRGATLSLLRQHQFIADVHVSQGHYTHALRLYSDAFAAFEQGGYETDATWIALNMVECYLRLNRYSDAYELGQEAIARSERCGTPTEAAKARFACALALGRLGESERALGLLEEAAATFSATNHASDVGNVLLQRASLHLGEADWDQALDTANQARQIFAERNLSVRLVQTDLIRARALFGLDRETEMRGLIGRTLTMIGERGLSWLTHECHHLLAQVAAQHGDYRASLAECDAALAAIESVHSRLASDLGSTYLADKMQIYHDAIDLCLQSAPADHARALHYLERAKSRALVDYLAGNPEVRVRARHHEDQPLVDELRRLRAEHDWFYSRLYGYGLTRRDEGHPDDSAREQEAAVLQAQIRDRERRIARLSERLDLRQADGLTGLTSSPRTCAELQAGLDGQTVLVEFYLHDRGGVAFVVTERALATVPLAVNLGMIRQRLNLWQLGLESSARALLGGQSLIRLEANVRGHLQAMYRALIAPLAPYLDGYERLVVIPFGPLHQIPFHALHDGEHYLIEQHEVVACPSSSLLGICVQQPKRGGSSVLVIANSDQGHLPSVTEEARAVADLMPAECYLEEAATRSALSTAAPRHAILHLAAHGEARLDNPTFAHLRLADGQLSPADVFNLDLRGALVVLSGCETGRVTVRGGDELIGLSRAFLHAGTSTLVQSLWRVEDGTTTILMRQFYNGIAQGKPKGTALREAQLVMLHDHNGAPYFWAPFQLVGDYGRA